MSLLILLAPTDICVLSYSDGHIITNWFQNRRSRDTAHKTAAAHPDTVVETAEKDALLAPDDASTGHKCPPTTPSAPVVTKPRAVVRPAASGPPLSMQNHFSVPMYPRDAHFNGLAYGGGGIPGSNSWVTGAPPPPAHQAGPTIQVSFLDDFSTGPTQQQRWGMQVELKSSDPNLPNLLGAGMLHGAKKGIKPIAPEVALFPSISHHLPSLRMLGPVPSPGLPPYRPMPTIKLLPVKPPIPNHVPLIPQPPTSSVLSSAPGILVERPLHSIPPTNPTPTVPKATGAEAPSFRPTIVLPLRHQKYLSRAMSLEYYAGMIERNRSPCKKAASAPSASPKEAYRTPVKDREGPPLWTYMVSSPPSSPSPTSPTFSKTDMKWLKPLIKSGRTKSLEFACALARTRSSDFKNTNGALGNVGAKRKRPEDLLLEPRGRKMRKTRRTFSSGVRETHKETRGLRKAASIAAIPSSQAETKGKEKGGPMGSTETREAEIILSRSSFSSNATTLGVSDDESRSSTINASPGSSLEIRVTDWSANAREKENKKPEITVEELEKNAVEVLASILGTRV